MSRTISPAEADDLLYLHLVGDPAGAHAYVLDHRLRPEIRAMLCAMASRAPAGGIKARYLEILTAVLEEGWDEEGPEPGVHDAERLLTHTIPAKVQAFFDVHVARYGHSSPLELTGPSVYMQGVSLFTAYQSFDSPLVRGQEFSTRAKAFGDWPMCAEAQNNNITLYPRWSDHVADGVMSVDVELEALHAGWLEVFVSEVAWWKDHLSVAANRSALGIGDVEPFRPAYDRARWALPGTIATGFAHCADLRTMARVIADGRNSSLQGYGTTTPIWDLLTEAYRVALPAMAGLGLREAVATTAEGIAALPFHRRAASCHHGGERRLSEESRIRVCMAGTVHQPVRERTGRSYVDPSINAAYPTEVEIPASWAVLRDWHRHRTFAPWQFRIKLPLRIHPDYSPKSDLGKTMASTLLHRASRLCEALLDADDINLAMLCLPLGAVVPCRGIGGLRDAIYMLELRSQASGANFEYKAQATAMLRSLAHQVVLHGDKNLIEATGLRRYL